MMIVSSLAGQKTKTDDADVMTEINQKYFITCHVYKLTNLRSPELIDLVARWD